MAVSTTQSIWRSGGGDQSRAAYCGSGVMAATFYIPAAGTAGNVQASATNTARVVLPAGAVPLNIIINDTGTGQIDLGFTDGTTPSVCSTTQLLRPSLRLLPVLPARVHRWAPC